MLNSKGELFINNNVHDYDRIALDKISSACIVIITIKIKHMQEENAV